MHDASMGKLCTGMEQECLSSFSEAENLSTAWISHGRQLFIQKVGSDSLYTSYLAGSPVSKACSQLNILELICLVSWFWTGFDPADRQVLLQMHVQSTALPSLEKCDWRLKSFQCHSVWCRNRGVWRQVGCKQSCYLSKFLVEMYAFAPFQIKNT